MNISQLLTFISSMATGLSFLHEDIPCRYSIPTNTHSIDDISNLDNRLIYTFCNIHKSLGWVDVVGGLISPLLFVDGLNI